MIPEEMCSGTCAGKKENCPCPQACGWPDDELENEVVAAVKFILTVICVIMFCFGVIVWL